MDVTIIAETWNDRGGGRERYLAALRQALTSQGRTVRISTRAAGLGPALSAAPVAGATHYQLHSGIFADGFAAEGRSLDSGLRRAFARPALWLNARRQRLLRVEERLLRASDGPRLMVFAAKTREALHHRFDVDLRRVTLARPGVDLQVFRPGRDVKAGPVRLLFVGHNFVLKGLRCAIEALALSRRRGADAALSVVGDGSTRACAALARHFDVGPHVAFLGALDREPLAALYRSSDLLIHPTFYDSFGHVVIEALASGVPVATTAACGAAEILTPGQDGFVIDDPRDADAFAAAIDVVAGDRDRWALAEAAGRTGRGFDFETHVRAVALWLATR